MSRLESAFLQRFSGTKIVIGSTVLALVGFLPLLLYVWFGPKDGNPIGLGLLAFVSLPFAGVGIVVGLVKTVFEFFQGHRK